MKRKDNPDSSVDLSTIIDICEDYHAIVRASQHAKLLVILQGMSGSGKSTIAAMLQNDCQAHGASVEIFSTDNYFYSDKDDPTLYCFRFDKLAEYHNANQKAASSSQAQVIIIDNTNLNASVFRPYRCQSPDRICVVLATRERDIRKLYRRTLHGLTKEMLVHQQDKFEPVRTHLVANFLTPESSTKLKTVLSEWYNFDEIVTLDHRPGHSGLCKYHQFYLSAIGKAKESNVVGTWSCKLQEKGTLKRVQCLLLEKRACEDDVKFGDFEVAILGDNDQPSWQLRNFWEKNDLKNDIVIWETPISIRTVLMPLFPWHFARGYEGWFRDPNANEEIISQELRRGIVFTKPQSSNTILSQFLSQ